MDLAVAYFVFNPHPRYIMASQQMYLNYEGFILPCETHSTESLKFAREFTFKDDDVLVVTYPKSGECFPAQAGIAPRCFCCT